MIARRPTTLPALAALALSAALTACGGAKDGAADSAGAAASATPTDSAAAATPAPTTDSAGAASPGAAPTTAAPTAAGALLDPNAATREQLAAVPGMPAPAVDVILAGRPWKDMLAVDRALAAQVPDSAARRALYAHVFKPIDLNAASDAEMKLIPGVGRKMAHEFEEYRPYKDMARFRREIGKYVDSAEVARLERYVSIR